jgi:uncharacterized membrane protein YhhN
MEAVFMIFFAAVTVLHLTAAVLHKTKLQAASKIFLIPPLIGAYAAGARTLLPALIAGAILGWIGDILLIRTNSNSAKIGTFFRLGLFSFLAGHICYIIAMLHFIGAFSPLPLAIYGAACLVFCVVFYRCLKPPAHMRIPSILYEAVIVVMSMGAFQLLLFRRDPAAAAVFCGSLLFLVSDSLLARFSFIKKPKYGDFAVMLTYLIAQTAIILGLASC